MCRAAPGPSRLLFPELELVMDLEPRRAVDKSEDELRSEFEQAAAALPHASEFSEKDMVNPVAVDRDFVRFRDRTECEPSQVLRFREKTTASSEGRKKKKKGNKSLSSSTMPCFPDTSAGVRLCGSAGINQQRCRRVRCVASRAPLSFRCQQRSPLYPFYQCVSMVGSLPLLNFFF